MMPEIPAEGLTLILGGARSGKSSFAEKIAREDGTNVLYVATATAGDEEMAERIRNHRQSRPAHWQTLEIPLDVGRQIIARDADTVIVDCLTLLINNLLLSLPENASSEEVLHAVSGEVDNLIAARSKLGGRWLIVSNEVGLGLVPPYPLGRLYRDALGRANQLLAAAAERVIFMVAGLPLVIK